MKTQQLSFGIQGMREACAPCAGTIEHALKQLDGVITATVNYATEHATVIFNPLRVSTQQIIQTVRRAGFEVSQQHCVLDVDGLMYVSSAHTIARVLERVEGVVHAAVDLKQQHIELDVLAGYENRSAYEHQVATLGLRVVDHLTPHRAREFAARTVTILALTVLSLWSASAHAGLVEASILHAPLVVIAISVVMAYGIAWRFYHSAFETALLRSEFDWGVVLALVASASLFCGLPMALIVPQSLFTTSGFILAILLTAGWFIVRGLRIWVASPRHRSTMISSSTSH